MPSLDPDSVTGFEDDDPQTLMAKLQDAHNTCVRIHALCERTALDATRESTERVRSQLRAEYWEGKKDAIYDVMAYIKGDADELI